MKISWYGQSCFKIQNNDEDILINPYNPRRIGLRGPNFKATVLILTNPEDEERARKDFKEGFIISQAGEYETRGIFVYGTSVFRKGKRTNIYQVEIDGVRYGILGEIDTVLKSEELEGLDGIDVLFIPVGGKSVINAEKAVEIINEIEPKIIIPCCYKSANWQIKIKLDFDPIEKFLKEIGIKRVERVALLSLNKKDIETEETKVIILEPK